MGKGIYTEAAEQIMANDPPGSEIWISEERQDGKGAGFHATKREDGSIKLKKYHEND